MSRINQQHLADVLKLSIATVSKSLRNSAEIHPETRAQVIELAARMGYRGVGTRADKPSRKGSQAVTSIGLLVQTDALVTSLQNPMLLLSGLSEAARAAGVALNVDCVPLADRDRLHERTHQPIAMQNGLLAGVVLQHYFPEASVAELVRQLPCVLTMYSHPNLRVDSVDLDADHAMQMLLQRLIAAGHRRIGFAGAATQIPWSQTRYAGFVVAMGRLGMPIDPAAILVTTAELTESEREIERVVGAIRNGVTALVLPAAGVAIQWQRHLRAAGLRVPQDVSLVTIDADQTPDDCLVMTSARVPFAGIGREAGRRLIDRIGDPATPVRRVCLRCDFVDGVTVAPPRE